MGVSVHLIAIPDGLDAVKQVLRLTVQVSPTIPTGAVIGRPLSLDRWPEEIAALARSMFASTSAGARSWLTISIIQCRRQIIYWG